MTARPPLRVCYFGTYRDEYSRNRIMIEGLRRSGVQVVECHAPLWRGVEDRVQAASGGWRQLGFAGRAARAYARLLRQHRQVGDYDVLMVGYPGQLDVFLARLLAWWRRRPLAWDIFMSIYLIACERGLDRRSPFTVGALRRLEALACRLPERLILDTEAYADWFGQTHGVRRERFRLVPTGADSRLFQALLPRAPDGLFRVQYAGTFIANHGVLNMLEAARLLRDEADVVFEFIGDGPDRAAAEHLARQAGLDRVTFPGWLDQAGLIERAAQADVLLGAFGLTPQSLMTVQNKIYEGLALARPVVSGDSPTVRAALEHGRHIWLVERQNPRALADALLTLRADPGLRARLAAEGRALFAERYTLEALGALTRAHLQGIAGA